MPDKPPEKQLSWAEVEHHGLRFVVLSYQAKTEEAAPKLLQEPGQAPSTPQAADPLATALAVRARKTTPPSDCPTKAK